MIHLCISSRQAWKASLLLIGLRCAAQEAVKARLPRPSFPGMPGQASPILVHSARPIGSVPPEMQQDRYPTRLASPHPFATAGQCRLSPADHSTLSEKPQGHVVQRGVALRRSSSWAAGPCSVLVQNSSARAPVPVPMSERQSGGRSSGACWCQWHRTTGGPCILEKVHTEASSCTRRLEPHLRQPQPTCRRQPWVVTHRQSCDERTMMGGPKRWLGPSAPHKQGMPPLPVLHCSTKPHLIEPDFRWTGRWDWRTSPIKRSRRSRGSVLFSAARVP